MEHHRDARSSVPLPRCSSAPAGLIAYGLWARLRGALHAIAPAAIRRATRAAEAIRQYLAPDPFDGIYASAFSPARVVDPNRVAVRRYNGRR